MDPRVVDTPFRPNEAQSGPSEEGVVATMKKLQEQLYKLLAKMYNKCADSLRGLQRHPVGVLEREGEGPVGPGRVLEGEGEDPTGSAGVLERERASQVNPSGEPHHVAEGVPDLPVDPHDAEGVPDLPVDPAGEPLHVAEGVPDLPVDLAGEPHHVAEGVPDLPVDPSGEPCCASDGVPDPSVAADGAGRVDMVAPPPWSPTGRGETTPPVGKRFQKVRWRSRSEKDLYFLWGRKLPALLFSLQGTRTHRSPLSEETGRVKRGTGVSAPSTDGDDRAGTSGT